MIIGLISVKANRYAFSKETAGMFLNEIVNGVLKDFS
jgi:hypothetical protein